MAEAYNVRSNGTRFYVYRLDGNVQVAEYFDGASAQRDAAVRNMRHNEQMGKNKKKEESEKQTISSADFVKEQLGPDKGIGANPTTEAPDPPPNQGVSY